jgi:hypothetical protein
MECRHPNPAENIALTTLKRKRDEDTGEFYLSCASSLQYLDMRLAKYREKMSYVQLKDHLRRVIRGDVHDRAVISSNSEPHCDMKPTVVS